MKSLPTTIYVRKETQGGVYAVTRVEDAIDDDGPTIVGTYKLIATRRMHKVAQEKV